MKIRKHLTDIWSGITATYYKHFQLIFSSIVKAGIYFQVLLWFWQNDNIMWSFDFYLTIFTIFNCGAHLQMRKNTKTHHNWFLINCGKLVDYKGPGFRMQSFMVPITMSNRWPNFTIKWYAIQMIYSELPFTHLNC